MTDKRKDKEGLSTQITSVLINKGNTLLTFERKTKNRAFCDYFILNREKSDFSNVLSPTPQYLLNLLTLLLTYCTEQSPY